MACVRYCQVLPTSDKVLATHHTSNMYIPLVRDPSVDVRPPSVQSPVRTISSASWKAYTTLQYNTIHTPGSRSFSRCTAPERPISGKNHIECVLESLSSKLMLRGSEIGSLPDSSEYPGI